MDGPKTKGPLSRRDAYMDVGARATQDAVAERDRERASKKKPAGTCPHTSPPVQRCGKRIMATSAGTSSAGIQVPAPGGDGTLYRGFYMPGSRPDYRSRWRTAQ